MIQKKISLLGAYGVGKTSLVSRFVHSIFSEKYHTTIGVKIDKKDVQLNDQTLQLLIWDVYGEDHYQKIQSLYLRGSSGYMVVADQTRPDTLEVALSIDQRAQEALGQVPKTLIVNKSDLPNQMEASALEALKHNGWTIIHTSAKTGEHVEQAFYTLGETLLK